MQADQRYFRAYATTANVDFPTIYSPQPGVQFRMEQVELSLIATGIPGSPNTWSFDITGELINPVGPISSVGFSWKLDPGNEADEMDPYYLASPSSISLSVPTESPFTWNHTLNYNQYAGVLNIRAWAVIGGIKYWTPLLQQGTD